MCRKYEEVNPPPVNDFVLITDCTYSRDEVLLPPFGFLLLCAGWVGTPPRALSIRRYWKWSLRS